MFCIVSWHHEGRDLCFWDGAAWGVSESAAFFQTRKEAGSGLRKVKGRPSEGFLKPTVLDVSAYNYTFGKSLGPKPKPKTRVMTKLDRRTGIPTEAHG